MRDIPRFVFTEACESGVEVEGSEGKDMGPGKELYQKRRRGRETGGLVLAQANQMRNSWLLHVRVQNPFLLQVVRHGVLG